MSQLDIQKFSNDFYIRKMLIHDVAMIYDMTSQNVQYYEFCGRQNTIEDIYDDLEAVPPGKDLSDKYYIGFFEAQNLVAIMDLIDGYPDAKTAYIGFFMMNKLYQGKGIGTVIISELCEYLKKVGFGRIQLGYDKGNPQSKHFWKKNHFVDTREVAQGDGIIVVGERVL